MDKFLMNDDRSVEEIVNSGDMAISDFERFGIHTDWVRNIGYAKKFYYTPYNKKEIFREGSGLL